MTTAANTPPYYSDIQPSPDTTASTAKTATVSQPQHPTGLSMRKPCIVCGNLTNGGTRCDTHETELQQRKDTARNTPERAAYKRQMYGPYYRKQRKAVLANATHCAICGHAFKQGDKIEADHVYPGNPLSPLQPAHRSCNLKRGAKAL